MKNIFFELKLKLENILWGYAFLLVTAAYAAGLFIDLTGDAGLYAAISRQMVDSGDWFNLKINGKLYYEKPHLLFWLAGIGIKLFGNTNFAFKIFPVLYGWLGFYFTYQLGKTIYSKDVGKLAALFIATSQIFFLYSLDIHTDLILQTGVVLALWQLAAYLKSNKTKNFIFGFAGIGLAMLAKGPVGAVIPFFSVLLYFIFQKKFRKIFHLKWLSGIIIILIVISPALIHLYHNFDWLGIQFYFITNNFGRISGEYAGSNTDPFFYLYNMIWIFLPWTILVFITSFTEIKSWFSKKERNSWGVYLLGSVLIYLTIISIARGKAPNYFLIAVSPMLVISAKWLIYWKKNHKEINKNLLLTNNIFLTIFGLIFFGAIFMYRGEQMAWLIFVLAISSIAVVVSIKKLSYLYEKIICLSLIMTGTFNLFLNAHTIPELASYQGARQVLEIFEENRNPDDQLYSFALEEYELFFWADDSIENITVAKKVYDLLDSEKNWVYTNQIKYNDIIKMENKIDTVYKITQRGMNELNLQFLNPKTRENSLYSKYLIKGKK